MSVPRSAPVAIPSRSRAYLYTRRHSQLLRSRTSSACYSSSSSSSGSTCLESIYEEDSDIDSDTDPSMNHPEKSSSDRFLMMMRQIQKQCQEVQNQYFEAIRPPSQDSNHSPLWQAWLRFQHQQQRPDRDPDRDRDRDRDRDPEDLKQHFIQQHQTLCVTNVLVPNQVHHVKLLDIELYHICIALKEEDRPETMDLPPPTLYYNSTLDTYSSLVWKLL